MADDEEGAVQWRRLGRVGERSANCDGEVRVLSLKTRLNKLQKEQNTKQLSILRVKNRFKKQI